MQGFVISVEMRGKRMSVSVGDASSFRPASNKKAHEFETEIVKQIRAFVMSNMEHLAAAVKKTVDCDANLFDGDHH